MRRTGRVCRESLLRPCWWYHRDACTDERWRAPHGESSLNTTGSADAEQLALCIPCDREADLIGEALGGQLDRMTVAQDRLHDLGREEAEAQDAREVGAADAGIRGQLPHRLSAVSHDHVMVAIGAGEESAEAVVRLPPRASA